MVINTITTAEIAFCKYDVIIKFSVYNVLNAEELEIDKLIIDDEEISIPDPVLSEEGRLIYTIHTKVTKNCKMEIFKKNYFPCINSFNLPVTSIFDDAKVIDLGRIGLLYETKEDALILTWDKYPQDLDLRLSCPNGEVIGIIEDINEKGVTKSNYYGEVSVDSRVGYGPETITISHWADTALSSKYKIGGHFEFYVKWWKD